jgi:flagellar biosynthesis protein FlhF
MSAPVEKPINEPERYRIVVRSAAEAVALVRERFGEAARVISVRQLEAGGLARFIQKPRLEVIVEVPVAGAATSQPVAPSAEAASEVKAIESVPPPSPAEAPVAAAIEKDARETSARRAIALLRATGLDEMILERVRADHPGLDWSKTPAPESLTHLAAWLRKNYEAIARRPAGKRRVFFGSCGVGKTSALCKALALDVFVRGLKPAVLKLDGEQPNATDGLAAFCDVLGVPLLRSAAELDEFDEQTLVYIDVPGTALDAQAEQARFTQTLDALRVDTRVLVINAASETELIADTIEMGRACGATHVVFSHADEVRRPGKLWRFILFAGLRPLFLSAGPSPAGDIEENVFSALLARTFPRDVARAAGSEGGRA